VTNPQLLVWSPSPPTTTPLPNSLHSHEPRPANLPSRLLRKNRPSSHNLLLLLSSPTSTALEPALQQSRTDAMLSPRISLETSLLQRLDNTTIAPVLMESLPTSAHITILMDHLPHSSCRATPSLQTRKVPLPMPDLLVPHPRAWTTSEWADKVPMMPGTRFSDRGEAPCILRSDLQR
jgi:hypothetical protein